jgi:hypothetical protein
MMVRGVGPPPDFTGKKSTQSMVELPVPIPKWVQDLTFARAKLIVTKHFLPKITSSSLHFPTIIKARAVLYLFYILARRM